MKLSRHAEIERLCEDVGTGRDFLAEVMLDTKHSALIASDGKALAFVPVTLEEGDTAGRISGESLKKARRDAGKKMDEISINVNGSVHCAGVGKPIYPRTEVSPDTRDFPDYGAVMPKWDGQSFGIDAGLLLDLAKALGAHPDMGGKARVILTLPKPDEAGKYKGQIAGAIKVTVNGLESIGVIMPVQIL